MSATNFLTWSNQSENDWIVKEVIELLMQQKEPLPLKHIFRRLYRHLDSEQHLYCILSSYPSNFQINSDDQKSVKLVTDLSICELHCTKGKLCPGTIPDCSGLHICKKIILSGDCTFKDNCLYGHDLKTLHNEKVLKAHHLDELQFDAIKFLLRQPENRRGVAVPKICKFYNVRKGCKHSVCPNLHLCKPYVQGCCKFGAKHCRRSHNMLSEHVKQVLKSYGINVNRTPKETLAELRQIYNAEEDSESDSTKSDSSNYQHKLAGNMAEMQLTGTRPKVTHNLWASAQNSPLRPSQRSVSMMAISTSTSRGAALLELSNGQATTEMICLFHLLGKCCFGRSCRNFHSSMPYRWRYKKAESWESVDDDENSKIELSYSDPMEQEYVMPFGDISLTISFKTMTAMDADEHMYFIQRLSTLSSVKSDKPFATQWIWYWKMETGEWREYGDTYSGGRGCRADLTSSEIEQEYLSHPDGQMSFDLLHDDILDFTIMWQRCLQYKTKREIRRRPVFVSRHEVEIKKKE